ncbi:MAG: hypothetical protein DWQ01_20540 [Planctomycetota bacterium]|nr:MAG: hypothetical protein DWQ01_20540 [Planctomycetota bacterium]
MIDLFLTFTCLASVAGSLFSPPQEAVISAQNQARILERFADFPDAEKARVVKRIYQAALEADHPMARAAKVLEEDAQLAALEVLDPEPSRHYDPERYAPALQLRTKIETPKSQRWKRLEKHFFRVIPLPVRDRNWQYDYGRNALLHPEKPLSPTEQLQRLMAGQWPEPGRIAALAEAVLDHDAGRDAIADYFQHHYRDRNGRVYRGIRLEDVWGSGRELEVSDVEAIAWLRLIAKENRVTSPINSSLHRRIYGRISDSFADWRDYRLLRQGLAWRLEQPDHELPIWFSSIGDSVNLAWAYVGHDPHRMRNLLKTHPTRQRFFQHLEQALEQPGDQAEAWRNELDLRPQLPVVLANAVRQQLRLEGLFGLGRR